MHAETLRRQGAEACRAYFTKMSADVTAACMGGLGGLVLQALVTEAVGRAAEAVGILDAAGMTTFAEGFVAQAIAEIEVMRGSLPITLP